MHIEKFLFNFKKEVDRELKAYLDKKIKEIEKLDFFAADLLRHARKIILSGGKRLRPAFMYWGYLAGEGKERKKILKTSISIELVHNFLLMHDDIIDRGQKRHGVETVNSKYAGLGKIFFDEKNARHFGDSMALISGDLISTLGNQVIFNSEFSPALVVKALRQLQSIVAATVVGEIQDVYMDGTGKFSERAILDMYRNKTTCYTVEGPLHLGAILAGADKKLLGKLSAYAFPLGEAFQIQDDILGIFGTEKRLGKEVGLDIKEGKKTLLLVKALELGNQKQKKFLKEVLGKKDLSPQEIKEFQKVMKESGALDYVRDLSWRLTEKSRRALKRAGLGKRTESFLLAATDYLVAREI